MDMNSKIFIAGHNGLVGSAILRCLRELGYKNLHYKTHHELDLTNQMDVAEFFRVTQPEYVFLSAAKVGGIYANNTFRAQFVYENLQIQNNIIHQSYLNGIKKLLFLGSSCIYPKNCSQPIREEYLLTGELEYSNEPYAIAKIAGIRMCESYNIQYGTNFISVMPTNLYGPNDNFDLENSHVLPAMIRKFYLAKMLDENNYLALKVNLNLPDLIGKDEVHAILNKYGISKEHLSGITMLKLWGSGNVSRELMHVDDMVSACMHIMHNVNFTDLIINGRDIKNTHINIGTGVDILIKELAYIVSDLIEYKGKIEFDNTMLDGTRKKLQDVTKLNNLGWKHTIDLKSGVKKVIDWYLDGMNK